jgi:hypothetical protein
MIAQFLKIGIFGLQKFRAGRTRATTSFAELLWRPISAPCFGRQCR